MWLLDIHTRQLEEFIGEKPPYAILSHTWGDNEVTFQDIQSGYKPHEGYAKLDGCCKQAFKDRYQYVWIDTCCIDKSSSAELSEAINSIFQWYKQSSVCYVYLDDVSAESDPFSDSSEFRNSRWFTRGWTLQELLAPQMLVFFDKAWKELKTGRLDQSGTKSWVRLRLIDLLSDKTRIPKNVLYGDSFQPYCAAARLAWAADRQTTRIEDRVYSLLGLLDVHMPLLYGEGNKAFLRLQEEVIRTRNDLSILAWGFRLPSAYPRLLNDDSVLAQSPSEFSQCYNFLESDEVSASSMLYPTTSHSVMTNIGLQMAVPIRPIDSKNMVFIAMLRCVISTRLVEKSYVVLPLVRTKGGDQHHFSRVPGAPPFLIRHDQLVPTPKVLPTLQYRVRSLWRLFHMFDKKLRPTHMYLRPNPDISLPPAPWPMLKNKYFTNGLRLIIREVISRGFKVASYYPPWMANVYTPSDYFSLQPGRSNSARFIVVFSKPREFSTGRLFFAISISRDDHGHHVIKVNQGSALEYLMERAKSLQVDIDRHRDHGDNLELNEEVSHRGIRFTYHISFQKDYLGNVKCGFTRTVVTPVIKSPLYEIKPRN
ncbi:HET-domain-containing protein [Whalleya microplaca]|nr:HET-domain-containing protein [Whalleya microplaca]